MLQLLSLSGCLRIIGCKEIIRNEKENKCIGCRRYYESTCRFSPGAHFTFLTDGVVEAGSPKGELARKTTSPC